LETDLIGSASPADSAEMPAKMPEMPVQPTTLPLIAILGPTASGKSALAVALAEKLGGEVIACDSTQVYRGFDIGTAKPSAAERRNVPHHMMDLVSPVDVFTAGEYRQRALEVLEDLRHRRRLPIFTVGTGLYFRALMEGLADAPARSDRLRAKLNATAAKRGGAHLHKILRRLDSVAAERISPNDRHKLVRAVEVCLLAGRPLSELYRAGRRGLQGYAALKIGLNPPRQALYERIERRVHFMLDQGWREEVAALIAEGAPKAAKAFEFIGYRELRAHAETGDPLSNTVEGVAQATRRYAKRQLTWFRRESGVQWFGHFGDSPETLSATLDYLWPSLAQLQNGAGPLGPCDTV
jgi:tRNA dimethylallyltransferase